MAKKSKQPALSAGAGTDRAGAALSRGRRGGTERGPNRLSSSQVSLTWLLRGPAQIALLGFLICLWFGPVFQINLSSWRNHAASFDMVRAMATVDAWKHGLWDGRWFAAFDGGFGYPFLSFYAPLCSWGTALLILLGNAPPVAVVLHLMVWLALGTAGMYLAASRFWRYLTNERSGGVVPGLIAAVGWLMSPYPMCDVYVRGDGPEFIACQILPWILYAGWGLLMRQEKWDRRDWMDLLLGGLAMSLGILSHNFMAMAGLGFGLVLVPLAILLRVDEPAGSGGRWRGFVPRVGAWFGALAWALLATAFFWLPSLREGELVRTTAVMEGALNYSRHFLYWSNLTTLSFWGMGDSVPGPEDGMPLHLGFVSLLAMLSVGLAVGLALAGRFRDRRLGWGILVTAAFTIAALLLTHQVSKPIWDHVKIMQYGQFSWRLLSVPTLGVCLLLPALPVALKTLNLPALWRQMGLIVAVVSIFCAYLASYICYYNQLQPDDPPGLMLRVFPAEKLLDISQWTNLTFAGRPIMIPIRTAISDEYGPRWRPTTRPLLRSPGSVMFDPPLKVLDGEDDRYAMRLEVENPTSGPLSLSVGYNYYPAWKVWSEPRSADLSLGPTPETGYLQVNNIPPGKSTIHLYYGDTPLRAWTKLLTGVFWLVWLGGAVAMGVARVYPRRRGRGVSSGQGEGA